MSVFLREVCGKNGLGTGVRVMLCMSSGMKATQTHIIVKAITDSVVDFVIRS